MTPNALLDAGTYAATFEFRAEDRAGPYMDLHPLVPPSVKADTRAAIHRTLTGFQLPAHERAAIDPLSDRVRVTMRLADGTRWPCGVFVWASGSGNLASTNATFAGSLYDLGLLLDDEMPFTYGLAPGDLVTDAMSWLVADAGVEDVNITPSDQRVGGPLNWIVGTLRRQVLADLAARVAYTPVYFDNTGQARAHPFPPLDLGAGHQYPPGPGSRVVGGDVTETLISAPGVHLVIGSGVSTGQVSARAEVPFTSPLHPTRRRQTRTAVHRPQGVTDSDQALTMAVGYANRAAADYRTVSITTTLDPRHDLFQTVDYALPGQAMEVWRELVFTYNAGMPFTMTHDLAKGLDP